MKIEGMERKIRTKVVEVSEEYFAAHDGTEFKTEDLCLAYEKTLAATEGRNKRVQFVIKPSVNEKLDELVQSGAIKSKNVSVNFFQIATSLGWRDKP